MTTLEQRSRERLERLKASGVRVLDAKPEGWHYLEGATTAPRGYKWAGHGSRFWRVTGGEPYEHALIRQEG